MALGFGPSIEHEILTQPYVVDLLISFCYAGAQGRRIREYPTGMSLSVPFAPDRGTLYFNSAQSSTQSTTGDRRNGPYNVKYDQTQKEVIFDQEKSCQLRRGDWIVLTTPIGKSNTSI